MSPGTKLPGNGNLNFSSCIARGQPDLSPVSRDDPDLLLMGCFFINDFIRAFLVYAQLLRRTVMSLVGWLVGREMHCGVSYLNTEFGENTPTSHCMADARKYGRMVYLVMSTI